MPSITTFEGVRLGVPASALLVDAALSLASQANAPLIDANISVQVVAPSMARVAQVAALGTANLMLAMAMTTCTLGSPPSDIDGVTDSNGNVVLRCGHSPAHEWDYQSGHLKP